MKLISTLVLALLTVNGIFAQQYSASDEGSKVRFVIKNFGISTGGTFNGLKGTINFDPASPLTSSFDVTVDASTIDTDIESRDRHLRKEDYFDVEKYPVIRIQSTKITKTNSTDYLYFFGTLTIKGVSKEIKFPFKAIPKDDGFLFEGEFKINRRDFGVGGSSLSLSDDLSITLSVFAKKS
jgi:polyisoprenoid-binding protein YceI